MMAFCSACTALHFSCLVPEGIFSRSRIHPISRQCSIPLGAPLYPVERMRYPGRQLPLHSFGGRLPVCLPRRRFQGNIRQVKVFLSLFLMNSNWYISVSYTHLR